MYLFCLLSVPYALDEPTMNSAITCAIHCAVQPLTKTYDMNVFGQGEHLQYENFFYICLSESSPRLVLDVINGNNITFSEKEPGKRSQLWSQNVEGRIIHEGTTPSLLSEGSESKYCLDIAELAVVAEGCSCLALRKVDSRRVSKQVWKFREDGRLTCGIQGQCIQALPAFGGMRAGAKVALGPYDGGRPPGLESTVGAVKMLLGSGVLAVTIEADGPTRVLRICDLLEMESISSIALNLSDSSAVAVARRALPGRHTKISINLPQGLGVSLVDRTPEELIYACLNQVSAVIDQNNQTQKLSVTVKTVQVDNQLYGNTCHILLYSVLSKKKHSRRNVNAVEVNWQRMMDVSSSMHVFKHLLVQLSKFSLDLEELVFYRIVDMFTSDRRESEELDVRSVQQMRAKDFDIDVKKYYFGLLQVHCGQLTLSVHTAKLPPPLIKVKQRSPLKMLVNFENAKIDFKSFVQMHPFESIPFLLGAVGKNLLESPP